MSTIRWTESVARGVTRSLMSTFTSVADAVKELVDNPVDRAEGQMVEITIIFDRKRERIVVESDGGAGMGASDIADWLVWGANNHEDSPDDIGQYGQGGKAAAGFLARDVRIWARRRGERAIWMLCDVDWATRPGLKDFGTPRPVDPATAPSSVANSSFNRGHVRIEMERANMSRRWNVDVLKRHLCSTYAKLLESGKLRLLVKHDGATETLAPLRVPLDPKIEKVEVDVCIGEIRLKGWAGKLDRKALADTSYKSGMRLYARGGRLIKEGEWFGYNWQGKGSLNTLVGEIDVSGLTPNHDKTDFIERADEVWDELCTEVISQIAGLIGDLRHSEDLHVERSEQRSVEQVRSELHKLLRGTKKPRSIKIKETPVLDAKTRQTVERIMRKGFPKIELGAWEGVERSALTEGVLQVNRAHPAYGQFGGSKAYIAETVILRLILDNPDVESVDDYQRQTDALLHRWAEQQA